MCGMVVTIYFYGVSSSLHPQGVHGIIRVKKCCPVVKMWLFFGILLISGFISVSYSLSPCVPPRASIFLLNADVEPIGDMGVTKLSFNISKTLSNPSFLLHCQHTSPIRWILDEDLSVGEISQPAPSPTIRNFHDFLNSSTYDYTAHYFLELQHPSRDHVFVCEPFSKESPHSSINNNSTSTTSSTFTAPSCISRAVVLAELQYTLLSTGTKILRVEVLPHSEVVAGVPPLKEFDSKLKQVEKRMELISSTNSSATACPFILNLALSETSKALYIEWTANNTGSENTRIITTIQSLQNVNRFHAQMEEHCINVVGVESIVNKNKALSRHVHKFYPLALTYALGEERRTLKIFFDLAEDINFYYSWETPNPLEMIYGFVEEKVVYRGQPFTIQCTPSTSLFSQGVQISWDFVTLSQNHAQKSGFISPSSFLEKEDFSEQSGNYKQRGRLFFSRDFLVQNDLHSIQMGCVCPLWNEAGWVNYTFSVTLRDSQLPHFLLSSDEEESNVNNGTIHGEFNFTSITVELGQENFTLTCEASGVPVPSVEFILPKNNLGTEFEMQMTQTGTVLGILYFANVTSEHEGQYICKAKSAVGEVQRVFEIQIRQDLLPRFVVIILTIGVILIVTFALVSTLLLVKLKKEKADFIRSTEEAISKFREGFKTGDLGFNSNSEYKGYEIPISRWGLGNTLLGSGAFGVVQKGIIYHGENRQDVVAIKTVNSPKDVSDFENSLIELTIMSYIGKHEHVVSLVGACTDNLAKRSILIGVEYCANGDLLNYIQKRKALFRSFVSVEDGVLSFDSISGRSSYANIINSGTFTSLDLYKWAFQIASGMDFLASKKILHADLAARNVLLTQDNICKISDFGLSRQLIMSDNYTKKTNTPLPWRHMALESLKFRQFSSPSDVWGYGVTLYEIFTLGEEPWPKLGWTNEFMEELERGRRLAKPAFATNNMYNKIMLECWRNEPNERITFTQAKEFFETAISNLTSPEGKGDDVLNSVC